MKGYLSYIMMDSVLKPWAENTHRPCPGKSAVQKELQMVRTRYLVTVLPTRLEEAWHMGLLGKFNIPLCSVEQILRVQIWRGWDEEPLSVRQLLWISRLSRLPLPTERLWSLVTSYSTNELAAALSDDIIDTKHLDDALQLELEPVLSWR